jgi:hypothetical protein
MLDSSLTNHALCAAEERQTPFDVAEEADAEGVVRLLKGEGETAGTLATTDHRTSRTILPRTCPVSLSCCAAAASFRAHVPVTTRVSFP